ncbi:MAG TPA: cytochrome c [Pyrinomonadaceae bacterium]|nr:cytochrome c [Pyrinomonadaceae bacterium]
MKLRFISAVILFVFVSVFAAGVAGRLANPTRANLDSSDSAPDAGALFNSQCAKCHGKDGRAKTTRGKLTHARDLTSSEWQNDVSDERLFNSISHGKGKMPAFKKLSDDQIDSLVSYVRQLKK